MGHQDLQQRLRHVSETAAQPWWWVHSGFTDKQQQVGAYELMFFLLATFFWKNVLFLAKIWLMGRYGVVPHGTPMYLIFYCPCLVKWEPLLRGQLSLDKPLYLQIVVVNMPLWGS